MHHFDGKDLYMIPPVSYIMNKIKVKLRDEPGEGLAIYVLAKDVEKVRV